MGEVRRGRAALVAAALLALVVIGALLATPGEARAATDATGAPTTCGELALQPGQAHCFVDVSVPTTPASGVRPFATTTAPEGWSPQDIAAMYDLPLIPATVRVGSGPTVAVVEADNTTTLARDLATYRAQYGLGACGTDNGCLTITGQDGGSTLPSTDAADDGWDWETVMDVEAVSASCPACKILVVQADSLYSDDLDAAAETAAERADYVSMSWGSDDDGATAADFASTESVFAAHPDVTFVASTGDFGWATKVRRVESCGQSAVTTGGASHSCTSYPASSPHVVAAGGTVASERLSSDGTATWDQQVWGDDDTRPVTSETLNAGGSSSGCSGWTTITAAQATNAQAVAACGLARGSADISALADGFAMYHAASGYTWAQGGGTSLAAPLLAGMYARAGNHTSPFDIYARAGATPSSFTDVTAGTPTRGCPSSDPHHLCSAGPGWDGPTGLGTPQGLAGLAALAAVAPPAPTDTTTPSPTSTPTATGSPTVSPTGAPTVVPTASGAPTEEPTAAPTDTPTGATTTASGPPAGGSAAPTGTPTATPPGNVGATPAPITHSGKVRVKGKPHPRAKLRASYGTFGGGASVTVTWLVNGRPVAHGAHLKVKKGWLHRKIRYVVTASGAGLAPLALTSPKVRVRR